MKSDSDWSHAHRLLHAVLVKACLIWEDSCHLNPAAEICDLLPFMSLTAKSACSLPCEDCGSITVGFCWDH